MRLTDWLFALRDWAVFSGHHRSAPRQRPRRGYRRPRIGHAVPATIEPLEDRTLLSALSVQQIDDISGTQSLTVFDGKLYFGAIGANGDELHAYDPATGNVSEAVDANPGSASTFPEALTAIGGLLAFRGRIGNGDELIVFDPNAAAGSQITAFDINPGSGDSFPSGLTEFDGRLFFFTQGANDDELLVFDPNATAGNEITKFDINPAGDSLPLGFTAFDGRLFFEATGAEGRELYAFDPNGDTLTEFELSTGANISGANDLTVLGGRLFFEGTGDNGSELFVLDPAIGDAITEIDVNPGTNDSNPDGLTVFDGRLFFRADSGDGEELHVLDSTNDTVTQVADINTAGDSTPAGFTAFDGKLYFSADGPDGQELYVLDPNGDAVTQVADIHPGTFFSSVFQTSFPNDSNPEDLTPFAGQLVFRADSGDGDEVHAFDPATGQVTQIEDLNPGSQGTFPHDFTEFDGKLFFSNFGVSGFHAVVQVSSTPDPVINAGSAANDSGGDEFVVSVDGADLVVTVNGTETFRQALADTESLTLQGSGDDDEFTLDFTSGAFGIPITVNGGGQGASGDSLEITGGAFTSSVFNYAVSGSPAEGDDGDVQLTSGAGTTTVHFTGLEPIALVDTDLGADVTFNLTAAADVATLRRDTQDADANVELILDSTNGSFEDTHFEIAAGATLTINGLTGADDLTIDDAAFGGNLTINGDADADTVSFSNNATVLGSGSLDVDAETVNVSQPITAGAITGTAATVNVDDPGSIQDGVDLAAAGATVNVAAGIYAEGVTVDKSVTLRGAQFGVNPSSRTAGGVGESVIVGSARQTAFTVSAPNVTIDGFDISGAGGGLYGITETTSVDGTEVSHNFVHDLAGLGVAIAAGSSGALVSENEIYGNYAGVYLSANSADVQVLANEIRDHAAGAGPDQGAAVVFEGNNTGVLVANNFLADNAKALYVWDAFGTDFTGTSVSGNSITPAAAAQGVVNTNASAIDASANWWGSDVEATVAGSISGPVDFTPFLDSGVDQDDSTAGFQGDFSFLNVTALGEQTGSTGRIQEGVGLVDDGGTVNVEAGTFAESVLVDKDLDLVGATGAAADVVIDPVSGNGIEITAGGTSAADRVSVRHLTVTGASTGASTGVSFNAAVSLLELDHVAITDSTTGLVVNGDGSTILSTTALTLTGNANGGTVADLANWNFTTFAGTDSDTVDVNTAEIGGNGFFRHTRGGAAQDLIALANVNALHVITLDGDDHLMIGSSVSGSAGETAVVFTGGGGFDQSVASGNVGVQEQAQLHVSSVLLNGAPLVTFADVVEQSYFYGQGDDFAQLYDSAGNDSFVTAGSYSYVVGLDDGTFRLASGVDYTYGYSSGQAGESAVHYDSAGTDAYVASGTAYSYMSGGGFFNVAVGFQVNYGYSLSGFDFAYFIDSAGNDTFASEPAQAYMSGPGYFNAAIGFEFHIGQSFVGGGSDFDVAYNFAPRKTLLAGFDLTLT